MSDNLKLTDINDNTDLRTLPKEAPYLEAWRQFYSAALTGLLASDTNNQRVRDYPRTVDEAEIFANESMNSYEAVIQAVRADQQQP